MFKQTLLTLERLLAPENCHACGTILYEHLNAFDANLCHACAGRLPLLPPTSCPCCGAPVKSVDDFTAGRCRNCRPAGAGFDRLHACFRYDATTRRLIHQFKYQGRAYLGRTLARLMLTVLHRESICFFDALVPIPLAGARLRERSFNQARVLAEGLAADTQVPVRDLLVRVRETRAQARFDEAQRRSNVAGAFAAAPQADVEGYRLLLVDDIVTTGATAHEAAAALKAAGAAHVAVAAFAKG
ncbi:MAG: ComF family protein [Deltaproteobacteria bacterium]